MNQKTSSISLDALTALSMLDILKVVPQGQKYLFVSENEDQNIGVVLTRPELEQLAQECLWLSQHPETPMFYPHQTPVWRHVQNHGVVELYASKPSKPHALSNPRNECSVSMSPALWEDLATSLKALPCALEHTMLDEAILVGFINGVPSHKIEKAFEWCKTRSSDPWEMDKDSTPQWVQVIQRMDELSQAATATPKASPTVPVAPPSSRPKP